MANLRITQEMSVREPEEQEAIFVPVQEWRRIMNRIKKCGEHTNFYEGLGWCCIGLGGGALLSALAGWGTLTFATHDAAGKVIAYNLGAIVSQVGFVAITICAFVVGFVSLRFAKQHQEDRAEIRLMIVQDMQERENSHKPLSGSPQVA